MYNAAMAGSDREVMSYCPQGFRSAGEAYNVSEGCPIARIYDDSQRALCEYYSYSLRCVFAYPSGTSARDILNQRFRAEVGEEKYAAIMKSYEEAQNPPKKESTSGSGSKEKSRSYIYCPILRANCASHKGDGLCGRCQVDAEKDGKMVNLPEREFNRVLNTGGELFTRSGGRVTEVRREDSFVANTRVLEQKEDGTSKVVDFNYSIESGVRRVLLDGADLTVRENT